MEKKRINVKTIIRNIIILVVLVIIVISLQGKTNSHLRRIQKTKLSSSGDGEVQDVLMDADQKSIVINLSNTCWMFYEFQEDKVSSLQYYYEYESETKAKEVCENYQKNGETSAMERDKIEEVRQEGKYVVIMPKASSYENTTREEVIETYELLKELYQKEE